MLYASKNSSARPVAIWLLVGVLMIIVQIILGGITRLTGSGLSITEWQPILGTLPPLTQADWQTAFDKYKGIAQYKHLNFHFTLEDFKAIYFWEWLHRVWGRLIGLVFIIPFVIFLIQGRFKKEMVKPMVVLFLLGGLQGAIGWIMVKSGLNDENLYVSHIRLAIHFMLALGLLVYTFWFALQLLVKEDGVTRHEGLKKFTIAITALLVVQLIYGAFMAGLKAATYAPTWPDINGSMLPGDITRFRGEQFSFVSALVNNPLAVHFVHRTLAYALVLLIVAWSIKALKTKGTALFNSTRGLPLFFVVVQLVLGIMAVLKSYKAVPQGWGVFEWMAQLHQIVGILLLLSLVMVLYVLQSSEKVNSVRAVDQQSI